MDKESKKTKVGLDFHIPEIKSSRVPKLVNSETLELRNSETLNRAAGELGEAKP